MERKKLTSNCRRFLVAQFLSRLSQTFLSTLVRYEILESYGRKVYLDSQIWQTTTRAIASQISGITLDIHSNKSLYRGLDFLFLLMYCTLLLFYGLGFINRLQLLIQISLVCGIHTAFHGPIVKALPPLIVNWTPYRLVPHFTAKSLEKGENVSDLNELEKSHLSPGEDKLNKLNIATIENELEKSDEKGKEFNEHKKSNELFIDISNVEKKQEEINIKKNIKNDGNIIKEDSRDAHNECILPLVNAMDSSIDKIGRCIAPFTVSIFFSSVGFIPAFCVGLCLSSLSCFSKIFVGIDAVHTSSETKRKNKIPSIGSMFSGISVLSDKKLLYLLLNTLVTNLFIYPFHGAVLPVIIKESSHSSIITWATMVSFISLGGVLGPILSSVTLSQSVYSGHSPYKKCADAIIYQSLSTAIFILSCYSYPHYSYHLNLLGCSNVLAPHISDFLGLVSLFISWTCSVAANNHFTVYFNSISQTQLPREVRGKFIANILTIYTIANSAGILLFAEIAKEGLIPWEQIHVTLGKDYALSYLPRSLLLLCLSIFLRIIIYYKMLKLKENSLL